MEKTLSIFIILILASSGLAASIGTNNTASEVSKGAAVAASNKGHPRASTGDIVLLAIVGGDQAMSTTAEEYLASDVAPAVDGLAAALDSLDSTVLEIANGNGRENSRPVVSEFSR